MRQQGEELLPCCYGNVSYAENTMLRLEKMVICEIWFWKTIPVMRGRKGGVGVRDKNERKRVKYILRKKERKRGKAWLAGTGSSALDNLGHFCHCISIRRAETHHLPFISFPFQHLQTICILSVLPPLLASFHFSACHYISWMITYWQFLHWHSTDQDTTPPASKAGKNGEQFFFFFLENVFMFVLFLHPFTPVPSAALRFPPAHPPHLSITSWSLLCDPYETLHGRVTPLGPVARSYVPSLSNNSIAAPNSCLLCHLSW